MVRYSFVVACAAVCVFVLSSRQSCADIAISTFEEPSLATNLNGDAAFEGLVEAASQFRSGAVTFNNEGVFFGGTSWSGFGYARRTTVGGSQELYNNSNDLIALPAVGASGSQTWAVVGGGGVMTADAGYLFENVDITNTLYTWNSIANGDPFAGPPMGNGGGTGRFAGQDDFYTVRFTNTATNAFLDFSLADYRGNADNVNTSWQPFSLLALNASQLSVSFIGTRETNYNPPGDPPFYFMDTPAYAALDNVSVLSVTTVPEPSSCLLVLGAIVLLRRRIARRGAT